MQFLRRSSALIGVVAMLGASLALTPLSMRAQVGTPAPPFNPSTFDVALEPVASGLDQPVFVAEPDDGSGRLFVVEQPGRIKIVRDGVVESEPFLDIVELVESGGSEQGLLSVAFHPDYTDNGEFFVGYTARTGEGSGDNTIARYRVADDDPDRADPASGATLLAVPDPFPNHNGGLVLFGPDGYLYAGLGDGGAGGDPLGNAQNTDALLGTILRLDVDSVPEAAPYGIPESNPFADGTGGLPEIWAYGLRNPWRFSFDRETGDLWIADVGQNLIEEVNFQPAASEGGENYGWVIMEGTSCFTDEECSTDGLTLPVVEYSHDEGGCSVTGGYVYRGNAAPELRGVYLFADYCTGFLWGLGRDDSGEWALSSPIETGLRVSSFGEDLDGNLYLTASDGTLYRVAGR